MNKPIGILGGTFDPIHNGHLIAAEKVYKLGNFAAIKLVPCKLPVHKISSHATAAQRQHMIQLAIKNYPELNLDNREIIRSTPSYTIETLQSFRQEFPNTPLVLIIGMDSFLNLPTWKDWQLLTNYAHILVVTRPGFQLQWHAALTSAFTHKVTSDVVQLLTQLNGLIYFFTMEALPISSSELRQQIKAGVNVSQWLPAKVWSYIQKELLYNKV